MCGNDTNYKLNICYGCNQTINDKYLLKALDKLWHDDCLKCACCDCRLGEIGCKLYTKANLILCKKDYLRYVIFYAVDYIPFLNNLLINFLLF
jgi:hypothetical protein